VCNIPGFPDVQQRLIAATFGNDEHEIRVVCVYIPNGQSLDSDKFIYKLEWLAAFQKWLAIEIRRYPKLIILGDFNIAPESEDVYSGFPEYSTHVSPIERHALSELKKLGLVDIFRTFQQPAPSFSWWDYRMGAFKRNLGMRIDLILTSEYLTTITTSCHIDRAPRTWEKPSDHAPVIINLNTNLNK
jgi:exodeoxyribonuclease III